MDISLVRERAKHDDLLGVGLVNDVLQVAYFWATAVYRPAHRYDMCTLIDRPSDSLADD